MSRAAYSGKLRLGAALIVALLHVGLVFVLIRAFAPDFGGRVAGQVLDAFTVTITAPRPMPPPPKKPVAQMAEGSGAAGKRPEAIPVSAPSARVVLASQPAAPAAGVGVAPTSGADDAGLGAGAGGQGMGTGSGNGGTGRGARASKVVKTAGDINSTRDYPKATREARRGDYVIVALTVGTDGRVKSCRVHRPSKDPQSDQITCRLATERFRFRPATDATGNPVDSVYGWQQRWFDPRENN